MRRIAPTITVLVVVILVIIAAIGGSYYLISQNRKFNQKIKALEEEVEKLKSKVRKLKEKSGEKDETLTEEEERVNEEDLIKEVILKCIKSRGLDPAKFEITDIKHKNDWATGSAASIDQSMEGALFVLQKKKGEWQVVDFGTGIEQSNYPESPPEIWP